MHFILSSKKHLFLTFCLLTMLMGCGNTAATPTAVISASPTPSATNTVQPTATLLPTVTATPSPTHTPSPTPTPTATAVPANLSGNPRTINLTTAPEAKSGASCGLVDRLDFPIAPPDGIGVSRGGGDFGQFRDRYGKYHAGEDWGAPGEGSNFGKPVYSIGHGRVMYAQPEGWNRDKGVVIVEHVIGETREIIYSFYGHLDPPSVILEPGTCVQRGDLIGNIGKPRTSPHLHFEIRTHMPYMPGPGYWEEDPTVAGWLPPSQTIWNQRMASSPGVSWLRAAETGSQPVGLWRDDLFLTIEADRLTQTNLETGNAQPSPLVGKKIENALLHPQTNTLFLQTEDGLLLAYEDELLWEFELAGSSRSDLLPLPNGGVMVIQGKNMTGLSADGAVLWQDDGGKRPFAWTLTTDSLIYTLSGADSGAWTASTSEPPQQLFAKTGYPITVGENVWLYASDGIYRLNPDNSELIYALPAANLNFSTITPLPAGGALVLHTDPHDRRLLAFNADGSLRWNLSVAALPSGPVELVATDEQSMLFITSSDGNNLQTNLYTINPQNGDLTHIFNGGSRPFSSNDTWIAQADTSRLLINNAGGAILSLDPQQALEAVSAASPPN
ncbi:MAG: peptidoglycan DD-metalloendopeptidase family protein [Anaerolineae bacterium]|nr:peptidoglycan DD-metalloendopeptidase family protein [Anaerolineae bacterium]